MVDKLNLEQNPLSSIVERVAELCPAAVVNGKIDFERLRTEWTADIIEPEREQYSFTWVGKNDAIAESNRLIRKTLRLDTDASKDWENTKNLYIAGDNLDALKLLRNAYHKKVKMIYIDPPYNTGNDFVYCDDFAETCKEYLAKTQVCDTDGNRLVANKRDGGHFHSNWCSMMYPRLKIARDLLTDDGVIFISIDDNEVTNLRKICDEVFGENNFESTIKWRRRSNQPNDATKMIATVSEYCLVYAKKSDVLKELKSFGTVELSEQRLANYTNPDNDPKGDWSTTPWCASRGQGGSKYEIITPTGIRYDETWLGTKETFEQHLREGRIVFPSDGNGKPRKKVYKTEALQKGQAAIDFWVGDKYGDNLSATAEMKRTFEIDRIFDYSKPVGLIKTMVRIAGADKNSVVLDFFSGSATTAHAVMQLNAEDGGQRKFIMVQLPEPVDEKSEAFKAGYHDICEIGMERIRRAGDKIATENPDKQLDTGFRVLRVDSTNMKDVYYTPSETTKASLLDSVDNVKQGRTEMDLLFGVMVDRGLKLDMPIEPVVSNNIKYYRVNDGDLIACFADSLPESFIHEIAKQKPDTVVFRDSSFAEPKDKINLTEIFKTISPKTEVYVF